MKKAWWKSKQAWIGILGTVVDVASAADALPVTLPPGICTGIVAIGGIVLRNLGHTSRKLTLR